MNPTGYWLPLERLFHRVITITEPQSLVVFSEDSTFYLVGQLHRPLYVKRGGNISGLGICSFAHHSFAHLLRSLRSNARLWTIRSDHSGQMSDYEQIAQAAHDKWATVSDLLRSLMINEQIARHLLIIHSFFRKKNKRFLMSKVPTLEYFLLV